MLSYVDLLLLINPQAKSFLPPQNSVKFDQLEEEGSVTEQ